LLENSKWLGIINIDTPGPFVTVLKPSRPGRYAVAVANFLGKQVTTNAAQIESAGWLSASAP
jgi:hypothetical protein